MKKIILIVTAVAVVIEMLMCLPAFVVGFIMIYNGKGETVEKHVTGLPGWGFSILFWLGLYVFIQWMNS